MSAGHLFITHGDLITLACDAWLVPTDARRVLEEPWHSAVPHPLPPEAEGWREGRVRAAIARPRTQTEPAAWLANVGTDPGRPLDWYLEGVRQFVAGAAANLAGRQPLRNRARPLLALPLVGTRSGGATDIKGDVVAALIDELEAQAEHRDVDIVLVLWTPAAYAAGQAVRRTAVEGASEEELARRLDLAPPLVREARRLAALAEAGRLVLFIGAGVSAGAGLPLWNEMLRQVALESGIPEHDLDAFERLDPLDRARLVEGRLARKSVSLEQRVAAIFKSARPSLAHTLLASLPVNEIATTNYDQLFEEACEGAGQPVAVLPYESARVHSRWLLKMHGCVSRPDDIVLTRDDYLRYGERRAALAGIVQALLVTRHILFVGFSLNDDNFHRLVHDVRYAMGARLSEMAAGEEAEFGTALLLARQAFLTELWAGDVRMIPMVESADAPGPRAGAARCLDIFLDAVGMFSSSAAAHVLDPTFDRVLSDDERAIREALQEMQAKVPETARRSQAWARVEVLLQNLGFKPTRSS